MIVSKKSKTDDVYKIKLYHHGDVRDKIIVSKKSKTDDVYETYYTSKLKFNQV
jgi:hypothetical protein